MIFDIKISTDITNSVFESCGAICTWLNVRKLLKDKLVRGVDWRLWIFYTLWGLWNILFYPINGFWFSWAAGIVLAMGSVIWVILAYKYRHNT